MWKKSSYSASNTWCVETRNSKTGVEIRDSKNPTMPHIFLSRENFGNLLEQVKNN